VGWRADPSTPAWQENRRLIVDAAESQANQEGLVGLRIEDVAAGARCSRATLYRYFADKDAVVRAVLLRKAGQLGEKLTVELAPFDDPAERIAEGILRAVQAIRRAPWFRSSGDPDAAARLAQLAGGPRAIGASIGPLVGALLSGRGVHLRPGILPDEAAEWLLLVVIGLLGTDLSSGRTRAEQISFQRRFVAHPLLGRPRRR
jgi:AcrR family transcriptional regulator